MHRGTRRSVALFTFAAALANLGWLQAQSPAPSAGTNVVAPAVQSLPVRRVILYKSGVGYFEHVGRVRGSQSVSIDFTSGQLDDVLSSLTTLDLDGGRVTGVNYNSDDALDRRLGALRLPVGQTTSMASLLGALRGARIAIGPAGARVVGRLLGVERTERSVGTSVVPIDTVSIVTDDGEIRGVALDPTITVRLLDTDLKQEVGQYLSLLASARDVDQRRLTIATSGTGDRDLFVSYVSEVPVWKATYRVVLPDAGTTRKPLLQGWAIIDNTGAQDWVGVQLSLVAGAPQSFIQQISRPYYVQRPVVPLPTQVSTSPQTHQSALSTGGAGVVSGTVTDNTGAVMPGVTIRIMSGSTVVAETVTDSSGRFHATGIQPGAYSVQAALSGFRSEIRENVSVSGGMETVLNFGMQIGRPGEALTVAAESPLVDLKKTATVGRGGGRGGGGGGNPAAAGTPPPPSPSYMNYDAFQEQQVATSAQAIGDLFAYQVKDPVTIRRNQSALVPILSNEVDAERVSLWNPSPGGLHPLRGVWITNSTGLTLDGGSFSVIDGQAFAGEGLIDPMKPGERRLLSYATDLGVQVVPRSEGVPTSVTKVRIARGVVIQQTDSRQRRTYVVRNDDVDPRTVVIEHPVRPGWTLAGTIKPDETTAQWLRFKVVVAPKTTVNFVVEESSPTQSQYSVRDISDDQITFLVKGQLITPAIEASLRQIQSQKAEVARLTTEMSTREDEVRTIGTDQQRVRENMQSLKGSSEERQLVQRYVKQLDDQETRLSVLRQEIADLTTQRGKATAELDALTMALAAGDGGGL